MSTDSASWLFARGKQSVRIVRRDVPGGRTELLIYGPGPEHVARTFATVPECMQHQSEVERTLMAEGYTLRHASDRRRGGDRRRLTRTDRRRSDQAS